MNILYGVDLKLYHTKPINTIYFGENCFVTLTLISIMKYCVVVVSSCLRSTLFLPEPDIFSRLFSEKTKCMSSSTD